MIMMTNLIKLLGRLTVMNKVHVEVFMTQLRRSMIFGFDSMRSEQ